MIGTDLKRPASFEDEDVKLWFYRIEQGIKRRRKEEALWEENEKFENLDQWEDGDGTKDKVTVNKVGAWVKSRMAAIVYRNPRFVLTPESDHGYEMMTMPVSDPNTGQPVMDPMTGMPQVTAISRHKIVEGVLNSVINKVAFGFNPTLRRCLKAGEIAYGAAKVGYAPDFEDVPPEDEQQIPIGPDGLPDMSDFMVDPVTGDLIKDDSGRYLRKSEVPIAEQWFVDWAPYRRLIIDPEGENDFRQHSWVACEYIRPLWEVKKDRKLKNTADLEATGDKDSERKEPDPSVYGNLDGGFEVDPYIREYTEQVRLFEIYDFRKKRRIIIADKHGKLLLDEPIPEGTDHSPYCFYRPYERLGEFYPRPPLTDQVPINRNYNIQNSMATTGTRRNIRKIIVEEGAMDDDQIGALTNNVDLAVVKVKAGTLAAGKVKFLEPPQIGSDTFAIMERIALDHDEIAGRPRQTAPAKVDTATQATIMERGSSLLEDDEREIFAAFVREIGKKLLDSLQKNMTIQQAIRLQGDAGQAWQVMVGRDDIVGDYDVSVDVTEMMPRDGNAEMARMIQALGIFGQNPWLIADPAAASSIFEKLQIRDKRFIDAISKAAMMQIQAQMAPAQPANPSEHGPPEDEAQAASQDAGAAEAGVPS